MKDGRVLKRYKIKKYTAYLIEVETTNCLRKAFKVEDGYAAGFYDCEEGKIIVLTDDLRAVIATIGENIIKEIKKIGVGYWLPSDTLAWESDE